MSLMELTLMFALLAAGLAGSKILSLELGQDFAKGMDQYKELSKWRK